MLVIAHRGSISTEPENSIDALRKAVDTDVDMIEIDIRLTKDKVPVLSHNLHLFGTKRRELAFLRRYTLSELRQKARQNNYKITTLDMALRECFGKIYLNLDIKELSAVAPTIEVIKHYIKKDTDWDSILFSSFRPFILRAVRNLVPTSSLGMLHYARNPFAFLIWHRQLNLSAVGFHRLHINPFALETAKILGLFTYAYTVNRKAAADKLYERGIDGIVTDYPMEMFAVAKKVN